jgi:hypothetical protein
MYSSEKIKSKNNAERTRQKYEKKKEVSWV